MVKKKAAHALKRERLDPGKNLGLQKFEKRV